VFGVLVRTAKSASSMHFASACTQNRF